MADAIVKRLAAIVIAILLLVYVGCQFYNSAYSKVKTESAAFMTAENTLDATGFVIRKETMVTTMLSGVITYLLSYGENISAGGTVAEVFASAGDAAARNEVSNLQSEINRLTLLNHPSSSFATSPDTLDEQISQNIIHLLDDVHNENYLKLNGNRDNLLYLLNERQVITGKTQDFNARISALQAKLSSIHTAQGSPLTVSIPGYFISKADGYEDAFSYDDVLSITPEQLKTPPQKREAAAGVVGKVVSGPNWYIACVLPADQALTLAVGMEDVSINLPFASARQMPVQVVAVNQVNKRSEAAVIFQCDYMNSELAGIRQEPVQISTQSISGIRVSQKAVHIQKMTRMVTGDDGKTTTEEKEVQGVYVLYGSELVFKEIVPLYASAGFIICDQNQKSEQLFSGSTIQLYDEIVVEGADLYDGKIVS